MPYRSKASLLARIARGALAFKCVAPTGEAQSPRSSPTPAYKTARRTVLAPNESRSHPLANLRPTLHGLRRGLTATGLPSARGVDRPAVSAELLSWQAALDRGATDDVQATQSSFRHGVLPTPVYLGAAGSPPFGGCRDKVKSANAQGTVAKQKNRGRYEIDIQTSRHIAALCRALLGDMAARRSW